MVDQWYYAAGEHRIGPCSGRLLKHLATSGRILPTDTIWKEGIEQGVLASQVKHLFSPVHPEVPPVSSSGPPAQLSSSESTGGVATVPSNPAPPVAAGAQELPTQAKPLATPGQPKPVRKGKVVGVQGAVIVSQDGTNVKYRKKCTVCGYQDNCWNTMPITNGVTRVGFFCPTCRTRREVQIQGSTY